MPIKPSSREEEYFARQEFERQKKREEQKQHELKQAEKKRLKELHHMRCPKDGMELIEIDYQHIKVDKCSHCGGIWLDPGELESITEMEKSVIGKFLSVFK